MNRIERIGSKETVYATIALTNGTILEEVGLLREKIEGETLDGVPFTISWADVKEARFAP